MRKSDHRRTDNHHRDVHPRDDGNAFPAVPGVPAGQAYPEIQYLGKVLPGAIFGMLIVYCLRSVSVTEYSWGLPELIAGAATVGIHLWKRSMLLSIAAGTVIYMLLVQFVFV